VVLRHASPSAFYLSLHPGCGNVDCLGKSTARELSGNSFWESEDLL
jgi:hypothetical protein